MAITRRNFCLGVGVIAVSTIALAIPPVRRLFHPLVVRFQGRRTVEDRLQEFSTAHVRLKEKFDRAGVVYPPAHVVLLGLKDERRLEVYAGSARESLRLVADYPILAASGGAGPKLREGDRQVPEGIYALESLNPNSRFHAALRIAYPNDFDRKMAKQDGRSQLGGDIMIHGGAASVGCLAMGDPAAEDLFVLAADTGIENVTIIIAPVDLRQRALPEGLSTNWRAGLYAVISSELTTLRK
ncbi:MAG: L,D-transpeptidase family protein [Burkholderiales bacterium]|nr:L,D-transpeptidase family protein [Phycisphaerae bacterium]